MNKYFLFILLLPFSLECGRHRKGRGGNRINGQTYMTPSDKATLEKKFFPKTPLLTNEDRFSNNPFGALILDDSDEEAEDPIILHKLAAKIAEEKREEKKKKKAHIPEISSRNTLEETEKPQTHLPPAAQKTKKFHPLVHPNSKQKCFDKKQHSQRTKREERQSQNHHTPCSGESVSMLAMSQFSCDSGRPSKPALPHPKQSTIQLERYFDDKSKTVDPQFNKDFPSLGKQGESNAQKRRNKEERERAEKEVKEKKAREEKKRETDRIVREQNRTDFLEGKGIPYKQNNNWYR